MSYDYLPDTKIELKQRKDMFRINTDTRCLGNFMTIKEGETVLDIGCNNGALLLYASQYKPKKMVGVDCFLEAIELAQENMQHNHVEAKLIHAKIQDFEHDPFDVILCNPPFFKINENSKMNENEFLKIARHEESLTLHELFCCCKRLLKQEGRFYLIHRTLRLTEIIEEACIQGFKIKRIKPVYDSNKDLSTSCLFEIIKGSNDQVLVEKPIIIER